MPDEATPTRVRARTSSATSDTTKALAARSALMTIFGLTRLAPPSSCSPTVVARTLVSGHPSKCTDALQGNTPPPIDKSALLQALDWGGSGCSFAPASVMKCCA